MLELLLGHLDSLCLEIGLKKLDKLKADPNLVNHEDLAIICKWSDHSWWVVQVRPDHPSEFLAGKEETLSDATQYPDQSPYL